MKGYDENFLQGVVVPLPTFSDALQDAIVRNDALRDGYIADYPNYSVVTYKEGEFRSPVIVAANIDQNLYQRTVRSDDWMIDNRIGEAFQIDNTYYTRNAWDRGHMAPRATLGWGKTQEEAQHSADGTFYYSNACLQHENLNRDEWVALERFVYKLSLDLDGKITSFSGPIYGESDRIVKPLGASLVRVPAGFFKVINFINKKTKKLDTRAFVLLQDKKAIADRSGRRAFNNEVYQVTIKEIEKLAGLAFSTDVSSSNPMYFDNNTTHNPNKLQAMQTLDVDKNPLPERVEIAKPEDIVSASSVRQVIKDDECDVFITAAMVDPGSKGEEEWIAIANYDSVPYSLDGWMVADNAGKKALGDILPTDQLTILPGESRVLRSIRPLRLSNKADVIQLYNAEGERVDRVRYSNNRVKKGLPVLFVSVDV